MKQRCWLSRCNREASRQIVCNGYELWLCHPHDQELDEKASESPGYSSTAPAKGYTSHWPWKLVSDNYRRKLPGATPSLNFAHVTALIESENYVELMAYLDQQSKEDLAQLLVMLEIGKKAARVTLGAKL